jgi:hypothetical protein
MGERDYAADMMAAIERAIDDEPYVSRIVAAKVVETLRELDPDLLSGWLDEQAEHFVWEAIGDRRRSTKAHTQAHRKSKLFGELAATAEDGTNRIEDWWLDRSEWVVDTDQTTKKLGDMTKGETLFAADTYDARARGNLLKAAVLKKIAEKVGDGTVRDHWSEQQLAALFGDIYQSPRLYPS